MEEEEVALLLQMKSLSSGHGFEDYILKLFLELKVWESLYANICPKPEIWGL